MFGDGKEIKKNRYGFIHGTGLVKTRLIFVAACFAYVATFTGLLIYYGEPDKLKKWKPTATQEVKEVTWLDYRRSQFYDSLEGEAEISFKSASKNGKKTE